MSPTALLQLLGATSAAAHDQHRQVVEHPDVRLVAALLAEQLRCEVAGDWARADTITGEVRDLVLTHRGYLGDRP